MSEKKKEEKAVPQKKAPRRRLRKTVRSADGKVYKIVRDCKTPDSLGEISKIYEKNISYLDRNEEIRAEKDKFYKERHLFDPSIQEAIRDIILEDSGLGDLEEAIRICQDEKEALNILKDAFKRTCVPEKINGFIEIYYLRFCNK